VKSLLFILLKLKLQFYDQFQNASVPSEGGVGNFANLATKLVAMAMSLERLQHE